MGGILGGAIFVLGLVFTVILCRRRLRQQRLAKTSKGVVTLNRFISEPLSISDHPTRETMGLPGKKVRIKSTAMEMCYD